MSAIKRIQPKIHRMSGGLFANWMPNTRVEVGDFGRIRRSAFEGQGTLKDYGVTCDSEEAEAKNNQLDFKSFVRVELGTEASAADRMTGIGATVKLDFSDQGAFLFHLSDMKHIRPKSLRGFYESMGAALLSGSVPFDPKGVIVTEVHIARKATIIALDGKSGSINLNTDFEPIGQAFLSGAKGSVKTTNETGSLLKWIAGDDTVALLKMIKPIFPPGPGGPNIGQPIVEWITELTRGRTLQISDFQLKRYAEINKSPEGVSSAEAELVYGVSGTDHELTLNMVEVSIADITDEGEDSAFLEPDTAFEDDLKIEEVAIRLRSGSAEG